jgi:hypothetical protein
LPRLVILRDAEQRDQDCVLQSDLRDARSRNKAGLDVDLVAAALLGEPVDLFEVGL